MNITLITRNFFKRLVKRFGGYQADGTTGNGRCKVVVNNDGQNVALPRGTLLMRVKRRSRKWHRVGIVVREGFSGAMYHRLGWPPHRSRYVPHVGQRQRDRPFRPTACRRAIDRILGIGGQHA